jgi:hypothetical protein
MPNVKMMTMNQKEGVNKKLEIVFVFGISPRKAPPFPQKPKTNPESMEAKPRYIKTSRQDPHRRSVSTRRGATTNARLGASSWTAMAFPRSLDLTSAVKVTIPEGR